MNDYIKYTGKVSLETNFTTTIMAIAVAVVIIAIALCIYIYVKHDLEASALVILICVIVPSSVAAWYTEGYRSSVRDKITSHITEQKLSLSFVENTDIFKKESTLILDGKPTPIRLSDSIQYVEDTTSYVIADVVSYQLEPTEHVPKEFYNELSTVKKYIVKEIHKKQ